MKPTLDRETLIKVLHDGLVQAPWAMAAWLGGSDATGRRDRFSDIDLVVVVEDGAVEDAFTCVRTSLAPYTQIDLEFRLPNPTWHGHDQSFMRLASADPHLMIDLVVIKQGAPRSQWFLETERHGTPTVLFDDAGVIGPEPMDRAAHSAKLKARLERLRVTFPMFQPLVTRAVERDQPCDAAYFYNQLTLLPTVEVLRMRYCPDRFDFGMRYLRDDLPREAYEMVCRLALPGSLEGVRRCRAVADELFSRTIAEL
jgi:hypothetical protein